MLGMLHKDVTEETLDVHVANCFDTDAVINRLSKKLLTPGMFMKPLAAFG